MLTCSSLREEVFIEFVRTKIGVFEFEPGLLAFNLVVNVPLYVLFVCFLARVSSCREEVLGVLIYCTVGPHPLRRFLVPKVPVVA